MGLKVISLKDYSHPHKTTNYHWRQQMGINSMGTAQGVTAILCMILPISVFTMAGAVAMILKSPWIATAMAVTNLGIAVLAAGFSAYSSDVLVEATCLYLLIAAVFAALTFAAAYCNFPHTVREMKAAAAIADATTVEDDSLVPAYTYDRLRVVTLAIWFAVRQPRTFQTGLPRLARGHRHAV